LLKSALVYKANQARFRLAEMYRGKNHAVETQEMADTTVNAWWEINPINPTSADFVFTSGEETARQKEDWRLLELLLRKMQDVARAGGAAFGVFSEAGEEGRRQWNLTWNRIHTDEQGDYTLWNGERYPLDMTRPYKNLTAICLRNNIPLVEQQRTYTRYRNDPHTNIEGNERMAEDIVDFLLQWDYFRSLVQENGMPEPAIR